VRSVRRPHLLAALLVALAAIVVAVALASGGDSDASAARGTGYRKDVALIDGVALQQARCRQWLAGTSAQRAAIVDVLHDVVGGPTPYGPARALSASDATALFDRRCAHPYARGWLLYELYTRAAAFSGAMDHFE
jgi:hypothetical protein